MASVAGFPCPCRGGDKSATNPRTCGKHEGPCGYDKVSLASSKDLVHIIVITCGNCGFEYAVENAYGVDGPRGFKDKGRIYG